AARELSPLRGRANYHDETLAYSTDASAPLVYVISFFFFFNDPATTDIYTLSLHDALPISNAGRQQRVIPARKLSSGRKLPRRYEDRKSTRLNSSHVAISYAVFCLKKKKERHLDLGSASSHANPTAVRSEL